MNISFFISIFCLVFCLFFFFYVKWYIKRKVSASELLAEYRAEVYRLNAEINAVTDRDALLVEDRIKKLKEILEDTDKRVKVYVQELERSRTGEALYTSLGKGIRAALKTTRETNQPPAPELSTQMPKLTLVHQESALTPVTPPPSVHNEPKPPSKRQIRSQIEDLVKDGLAPSDIAGRLGISIAEVDLAMNLINGGKK
ncbi:MAG: hypothetical protein LBV17_07115 [Treponema sp.]|jgi:hypothetical protein|nr:hypothetical protein [Treponema sp.]